MADQGQDCIALSANLS